MSASNAQTSHCHHLLGTVLASARFQRPDLRGVRVLTKMLQR